MLCNLSGSLHICLVTLQVICFWNLFTVQGCLCIHVLMALLSNYFSYNLSFFLQRDVVSSYLESGNQADEQGVEEAFELLHEINERVRTGIWVGDCFIYNNSYWRLNYCVGGEVFSQISICFNKLHIVHSYSYVNICSAKFRSPQCFIWTGLCTCWGILLVKVGCILLTRSSSEFIKICVFSSAAIIDSRILWFFQCSVMGYTLLLSLIEYKTLVMRGDLDRANQVLPSIPKEHHNRYAFFPSSFLLRFQCGIC